MNQDERQYERVISNISSTVKVSLKEAQLILSGKLSDLSPEVQKKIKAVSLDPKEQVIFQELRDIQTKLELLASVSSLVSPKRSSPAKRTKDKASTALDAFIRKRLTTPNKEILVLARAKFPDMEITLESLKMRKTRLRNKSEGNIR